MLADVLKRLRGRKVPTAADIQKALDAIDVAALGQGVLKAEAARREALIGGADEAEVERLEVVVEKARKARERAEIARDELLARLGDAREREAHEALQRERLAVASTAEALERDIRDRWPEAQRVLLDLMVRLDEVRERNRALLPQGMSPVDLGPLLDDLAGSVVTLPRLDGLDLTGTAEPIHLSPVELRTASMHAPHEPPRAPIVLGPALSVWPTNN